MAFTKPKHHITSYASPGELYRDLLRRPGAVSDLWAHQSEILKEYVKASGKPDLALELPTGTGKTLVGLLIAEWNRQSHRERILYSCPTRQLAEQVRRAANREGIDVALLTGSHRDWDQATKVQYEAAQRVGVTTYSSIFNSHPMLPEPSVIVFDDAHAGEQYVGEAYSISVNRNNETRIYQDILNIIGPALDRVFLDRLFAPNPDPGIANEVRLVVPLRQPGMVENLAATLSTLDAPFSHRYAMIRRGISSCLVYVAYSEILIRPYIPPTHQNHLFEHARQRVYLSATLGEGGELERAFGRYPIERLHQPEESTPPRSGRRFFIFPEFISHGNADTLSKDIVMTAGKALVLSQRTDVAMAEARKLAPADWCILGIDDVSSGMEPFIRAEHAVCALAARYDGLDLPGKACQVIVFEGKPDQLNLQERFLLRNAQAGKALESRIRARIIQGAGRCTRGPEDRAIVLVRGELSGYLNRPENISALSPELQSEIEFGLDNSQNHTETDVLENVHSFLKQDTDDTWRSEAEPILVECRRSALTTSPPGSEQLSECASEEIEAWASASTASWSAAAKHAHAAGNVIGAGGSATRRYQAFWKYLEAVWTDMAAQERPDTVARGITRHLLDDAAELAGRGSWIQQMAQFPDQSAMTTNPADAVAVTNIAAMLQGNRTENSLVRELDQMRENLDARDPGKFEPALSVLGRMLGADASKPREQSRCDSTWCWDDKLWLALEAKSDHQPTGVVPVKDIRQANGQLELLAKDRNRTSSEIPPGSAIVIISPKPGVHRDGATIANDSLFITSPDDIRLIAINATNAWRDLLTSRNASTDDLHTLVSQTLQGYGLLPSNILSLLSKEPIGSTR